MAPVDDGMLGDAVRVYVREGYCVRDWGPGWAELVHPARTDGCLLLLLFPGVLLLERRQDRVVRLDVTSDGRVVETRR